MANAGMLPGFAPTSEGDTIGALPCPTMYDTTENYEPDRSRQDTTSRDLSRQPPTGDEYISVKEALEIFVTRGRSITERTLQRYCEKQKLDGQKQLTAEGEKWFVRRSSVHRCIDELDAFDQLRAPRQAATSRDVSAPVAEVKQEYSEPDKARQPTSPDTLEPVVTAQQSHPASDDLSRQDATRRDLSRGTETEEHKKVGALSEAERQLYERMISYLEEQRDDLMRDKELLQSDKESLIRQLEAKDRQIDHFFSSERDTKTLLGSLQSLMNAIWPGRSKEIGERYAPMRDALESGLEDNRRDEHGEGR